MKKVLTIGGATQDLYLHYQGADCLSITQKQCIQNYMLFESGEKIEVEKILYHTGGGSTNSAVSFKRLGFDTTCFCKIGNDLAGKAILQELEQEQINTTPIKTSKQYQSGTSFIIHSLKKERTIFAYRGANGFLKEEHIPFDFIKEVDQVYITSLSHDSAKLLPKIAAFAKEHNVPVATNPGISQLAKGQTKLKDALQYIDIIIMNSSEAKEFMMTLIEIDECFKKSLQSSNPVPCHVEQDESTPYLLEAPIVYENFYFSIRKFFSEILKMGPKIVVITNGKNGVYAATKDEILFHPSIKTDVVDTLGAGDAFGSCFVASLLRGNTIKESLRNGVTNSASVIGKMGAKPGLLTLKQLQEKL